MKDLAADTNGVTSIEYALIAGLIALVIVTAMTAVGTQVSTLFNTIASSP